MFDPTFSTDPQSADRLDAEVLSTLRSLMTGFASLQRAHDATRRYDSRIDTCAQPRTRARWQLLADIHPLLQQFMDLGMAPTTLLYDVPLLVHCIRQADEQIRLTGEFAGFAAGQTR